MTDSGKNWTLKPVEAAKMPGIRMPGGPRNVEGRAGADHTGPSAPGARIAFDQWALRGVCFRSEFLHKRLDMTAFCFALSAQSDNVLFAQSRNVLLTARRLGRCKKDNY